MKLSEISRGDVLQMDQRFGDKLVVVTAIKPNRPKNCITYHSAGKATAGSYIAPPTDFVQKIGSIDLDMLEDNAQRNENVDLTDERQQILANIKPNDPINILRRNGQTETWTFVRHLPRGRKYLFSAKNIRGNAYKFSLEQIAI